MTDTQCWLPSKLVVPVKLYFQLMDDMRLWVVQYRAVTIHILAASMQQKP